MSPPLDVRSCAGRLRARRRSHSHCVNTTAGGSVTPPAAAPCGACSAVMAAWNGEPTTVAVEPVPLTNCLVFQ